MLYCKGIHRGSLEGDDLKLRTKIALSNVLMFVVPILAILVVAVIVSLIFSSALGKTVDNLLGNNQSATTMRSQIHYYAVQCDEMENGQIEFERLVSQALKEENYRFQLRKDGAYCYSNLDILDVGFISEYRFYMDREDSFIVTGQQEAMIKHVEVVRGTTYELTAVNQNYLENAVYYSEEDVNAIDPDQFSLISIIVVLSIIIVALTAVIITHTLSRSILQPLQKLKVASRKIKDGDFRFHLHSNGKDELADLCNDFDDMRRRLQESVELQLTYEQEEKNLIAGMAHDLRTPITSIKGYIEGLRDGVANTPEKQKRYLDTLAVKTEDLNRLVDSLFLFSKLDTGKYPFHFETVEIREYMKGYVASRVYDCAQQGMTLHYQDRMEGPAYLRLSVAEMERVFNNIISNSMKYKPKETGNLTITLSAVEKNAVLCFADDGNGVPEESIGKLFQRFYRADPSRNNPSEGSGLGLSIAKQIVEAHGGTIVAGNNHGLSITITLPIRDQDQSQDHSIS